MTNSAKRARTVVAVCFDGVEPLDLMGPLSVLTAANRLVGPGSYEIVLAGQQQGLVRTDGGIAVLATHRLGSLRGPLDTLLVPGGFGVLEPAALATVPAIRRMAERARRVVSVCSGTFLLGEAGLLAGKRAATHWAGVEELGRRYPSCTVDGEAIYVRDGRLWTSAGVTAGIDLALALLEEDHGAQVSLEAARWLVMYLRRPGGQRQFSAALSAQAAQTPGLARLASWVRDHLDHDLSVPALAKRAAMSERNFARAFVQEIGVTPARWVEQVRLEAARGALEMGAANLEELARVTGFPSAVTLGRAFRRSFGVTPADYRERFAARQPRARRPGRPRARGR